MYENREVFPSTPLEFVAAEVRFPYAPRLVNQEVFAEFAKAVQPVFPVPQREDRHGIVFSSGGAKPAEPEVVYRVLDRSRTASTVLTQSSLSVETTRYSEYAAFRSLLEQSLVALAQLEVVVGVERVGLRYIDEVRVPGHDIADVRDWSGYIAEPLLAPMALAAGFVPDGLEGVVRLRTSDDTHATIRAATLVGAGVVGNEPLRRRSTPAAGPMFVLDIDSFWSPNEGELPEFDVGVVLEMLDRLHSPAGMLFQRAITERLKNEVLREGT